MTKTDKLSKFDRLVAQSDSKEVQIAYYELVQQGPSGFIMEGTERLPEPNEITAPSIVKIMNNSYYFKRDDNGVVRRVNIRYIHGVDEIEVDRQKAQGHEPNVINDVIFFRRGRFTVIREGNTIGQFDYLKKSSQNGTNPDRDTSVQARFREVVPEKEKMDLNELEFVVTEAMGYVKKLILSREGDKVHYDEKRLLSYCTLFEVTGATDAGKVNALIALCKAHPQAFLERARTYEDRFTMEILHGEEMGVIRYIGNQIEYVAKQKIILSLAGAFRSRDKMREALVSYFQSEDGANAYVEYLAELELAKKKSLEN